MMTKQLFVDILTGEVHETDLFGPTVKFKGGSSQSSTVTVDYAYNARMAAIAEKQQAQSDEYFEFYKEFYKPMEMKQIEANMELIPFQTEAEKAKAQTERLQAESMAKIIPEETEARLGIIEQVKTETALAQPVMAEYYKQALSGTDPTVKVAQARADVASSFKGDEAAQRRSAARMGIDPNSERFMGAMSGRGIEQAKATGQAMTAARNTAEAENFARLGQATQVFKQNIGVGG